MKSNLYKTFATSKEMETKGITVNFGDQRATIARAGSRNIKYRDLLQARMKPYRFQLDQGTMSEEVADQIIAGVYAETIVLNWEYQVTPASEDGKTPAVWAQGIVTSSDEVVPFTAENVLAVFEELPELFRAVKNEADKASNFRNGAEDSDAKNS